LNVKNTIQIRNATPEELDNVSLLLKRAYQQYKHIIKPAAWRLYLEDIIDVRSRLEDSELIVAELDGKLAGTVTLYLKGSSVNEEGWPEGWAGVRLLGVDPKYRGRGIGHELMEECVRRCKEKGIIAIGLHTTEFMDVARRMYERMGFKRVPEFDFHPSPDVVVMAYQLYL